MTEQQFKHACADFGFSWQWCPDGKLGYGYASPIDQFGDYVNGFISMHYLKSVDVRVFIDMLTGPDDSE